MSNIISPPIQKRPIQVSCGTFCPGGKGNGGSYGGPGHKRHPAAQGKAIAQELMEAVPQVVSFGISINTRRTNLVLGINSALGGKKA